MIDDATLEVLAEHVHNGWMAEKQRQGFADHVVKIDSISGLIWGCRLCSLPYDKHHADMLPYADLAEHIKEYDRATVRAVLGALESAGIALIDREAEKGT